MGRRHAENLRQLVPEARLVAVADVSAERAQQIATELEIEKSFSSLEAMLECKDIDAIVIATPDKFHAAGDQTGGCCRQRYSLRKASRANLADAHDLACSRSKNRGATSGWLHAPLRSCLLRRHEAHRGRRNRNSSCIQVALAETKMARRFPPTTRTSTECCFTATRFTTSISRAG